MYSKKRKLMKILAAASVFVIISFIPYAFAVTESAVLPPGEVIGPSKQLKAPQRNNNSLPFLAIATGGSHSCAVKRDKTVWCFGDNTFGQLGAQTVSFSTATPLSVKNADSSIFRPAISVTTGLFHTCALKLDGTVWCFGDNTFGQLGNPSLQSAQSPVQIKDANGNELRNVISLGQTNGLHTCAVRSDNTLWCWGDNTYGQLGIGTDKSTSFAQQVSITDVIDVNASRNGHTCALKKDKTVWCWGYNGESQLGDGTKHHSSQPIQVKDANGSPLSDVSDLGPQGVFTGVVRTNGSIWYWGSCLPNIPGLTPLALPCSLSPTPLLDSKNLPVVNMQNLSIGSTHSCSLKNDSTVWCWGNNALGELGDSTTNNSFTPVQVKDDTGASFSGAYNVSSGGEQHTCALKLDGTVWCWGGNSANQLGVEGISFSTVPIQVRF